MKGNFNSKYFKWGLTAFSVIVASVVLTYIVFHLGEINQGFRKVVNVCMPINFGLILAYLLTPIVNFIEGRMLNPLFDKMKWQMSPNRKKTTRAVSIICTSAIFLFFIYAFFALIISQIVPSIQTLISNFDENYNNFNKWLSQLLEDNPVLQTYLIPAISNISKQVESFLTDTAGLIEKSSDLLKTVSTSVMAVLKVLWNFLIGFIISIYVMCSKEVFAGQSKKIVYAVFERHNANKILRAVRYIHKTFIGYISGKILDSIIIGLLCFIGTTIMGTPYAALVSLIVGVTNIIPFFGPFLGAIPSAILVLVVDLRHPLNCVYFIIFILILQQVDGNIIGPKILGDSTGLSSFWVIFSITLFGGLFGVTGMLICVPVFAVFYTAVRYKVHKSLRKKDLEVDTEKYIPVMRIDEEGKLQDHIEETKDPQEKPKKKSTMRVIIEFFAGKIKKIKAKAKAKKSAKNSSSQAFPMDESDVASKEDSHEEQ